MMMMMMMMMIYFSKYNRLIIGVARSRVGTKYQWHISTIYIVIVSWYFYYFYH